MGFTDRMNEGFRGAKTAMESSEVRQRLLEAQIAQEQAFTRLGVAVHTAFAQGAPRRSTQSSCTRVSRRTPQPGRSSGCRRNSTRSWRLRPRRR